MKRYRTGMLSYTREPEFWPNIIAALALLLVLGILAVGVAVIA